MQMMIPMDLGQVLQNAQGMKSGKTAQAGEGGFSQLLQQLLGADAAGKLDALLKEEPQLPGFAQAELPQEEALQMLEDLLGRQSLSGEELAQVLTLLGKPGAALPEPVQQMLAGDEKIPVAVVGQVIAAIAGKSSGAEAPGNNPQVGAAPQPVAVQVATREGKESLTGEKAASVAGNDAKSAEAQWLSAGAGARQEKQQPSSPLPKSVQQQVAQPQQVQTPHQVRQVTNPQQIQTPQQVQQVQQTDPMTEAALLAKSEALAAKQIAAEGHAGKSAPMDARFAELLGGRESGSARQVVQAAQTPAEGQNQVASLISEVAKTGGDSSADRNLNDSGLFSARGEAHQGALAGGGSDTGQVFSLESARPPAPVAPQAAQAAAVKLPSGQVVPESQILDQVIEKAAFHANRDRSSLTIRLHPEELGELRLELVLEKGALRAHVHAQSHQVQDVLERNMFRLREALEQHGMRLDDVQVSVDDGKEGREQDLWQRQQQEQSSARRRAGAARGLSAEALQTAKPLPQVSSGGINLRV